MVVMIGVDVTSGEHFSVQNAVTESFVDGSIIYFISHDSSLAILWRFPGIQTNFW